MLRQRRFLQVMHRLALLGALLMAVAPVVSRWLQSRQAPAASPAAQAMCHGRALPMTGLPASAHPGPMLGMTIALEHGDGMPMPPGHDEAACDYCVLAANLLPFVLALLVLPLLVPALGRLFASLAALHAHAPWPAHAARGPPLHA